MLLPRISQRKGLIPVFPSSQQELQPLPSPWQKAPQDISRVGPLILSQATFHASPTPRPLYLCLKLSMEKSPLPQLSKCLQTLSLFFQRFSLRVTCHQSQSLKSPEISPGRKDSREITGINAECSQALPVLMPKKVKTVNDFW